MRSFLTMAAVLGLLAGSQPAFAQFYGPGPWCAVLNMGTGDAYWDCQYWSLQQSGRYPTAVCNGCRLVSG